jgi:hypothetical protein
MSKTNRPALIRMMILACVLAAASISCSVADRLVGQGNAYVAPTLTPRPTFTPVAGFATETPTPLGGVVGDLPPGVTAAPVAGAPAAGTVVSSTAAAAEAQPTGATSLKLIATNTPGPQPTPEPTVPNTATPKPTPLPTLVPSPTPFVVVTGAVVSARRGPGLGYELVGEARQGQSLMLMGRSEDQKWWQVCCVANQPVWVAAELVRANGATDSAPVMTPAPTPTLPPTPSPAPTLTPSPTPQPPFDIGAGPLFPIQRDTGILTIWVKVWEGPSDNQKPLAGYILKVFRNDVDVSLPVQSHAPDFDHTNAGDSTNDLLYNLKFEMYGAGEARWRIYLARPTGERVSPEYAFTTMGDSYRNQVMYIGYWLAR